jgi:hypothetical protein
VKRPAAILVLLFVTSLALALPATAAAASPTVEQFTIDTSAGPCSQVDVDGDLVVWLDRRHDPDAGLFHVWGALLGPGSSSRTFEIAAAGTTSLSNPRVSGSRVVWFDEEDYDTGEAPAVWESFILKDFTQALAVRKIADGRDPDVHDDAVVWIPVRWGEADDTVQGAAFTAKRRGRAAPFAQPFVSSASLKSTPRLSDSLLAWWDGSGTSGSRIMAAVPSGTSWQPLTVAAKGISPAVDAATVVYNDRNAAYGMFMGAIVAAKVDVVTLAVRTLQLSSSGARWDCDVAGDLAVWSGPTKVPGGSGYDIVGAFMDWSEPATAHEFVVADAVDYANDPAVTYDAASGRYLVVWATQAIEDPSDNRILGAWVTAPASWGAARAPGKAPARGHTASIPRARR